jgi:hypothetical protein
MQMVGTGLRDADCVWQYEDKWLLVPEFADLLPRGFDPFAEDSNGGAEETKATPPDQQKRLVSQGGPHRGGGSRHIHDGFIDVVSSVVVVVLTSTRCDGLVFREAAL